MCKGIVPCKLGISKLCFLLHLTWKFTGNGQYSSSSAYKMLLIVHVKCRCHGGNSLEDKRSNVMQILHVFGAMGQLLNIGQLIWTGGGGWAPEPKPAGLPTFFRSSWNLPSISSFSVRSQNKSGWSCDNGYVGLNTWALAHWKINSFENHKNQPHVKVCIWTFSTTLPILTEWDLFKRKSVLLAT